MDGNDSSNVHHHPEHKLIHRRHANHHLLRDRRRFARTNLRRWDKRGISAGSPGPKIAVYPEHPPDSSAGRASTTGLSHQCTKPPVRVKSTRQHDHLHHQLEVQGEASNQPHREGDRDQLRQLARVRDRGAPIPIDWDQVAVLDDYLDADASFEIDGEDVVAKETADEFLFGIAGVVTALESLVPAQKITTEYARFMKTLRTAAAPLLTEVTFPEALDLNAHPDEDHVFEIDGAFRESWSLEDRIDRRLMMEFRSRLPNTGFRDSLTTAATFRT